MLRRSLLGLRAAGRAGQGRPLASLFRQLLPISTCWPERCTSSSAAPRGRTVLGGGQAALEGLGTGEQPAVRARPCGLHAAAREPARSAEGGRQPRAPAPLPAGRPPVPGCGGGGHKAGCWQCERSLFPSASERAKITRSRRCCVRLAALAWQGPGDVGEAAFRAV